MDMDSLRYEFCCWSFSVMVYSHRARAWAGSTALALPLGIWIHISVIHTQRCLARPHANVKIQISKRWRSVWVLLESFIVKNHPHVPVFTAIRYSDKLLTLEQYATFISSLMTKNCTDISTETVGFISCSNTLNSCAKILKCIVNP